MSETQVAWDVDGHRLPTEAEWERAARGGLEGKRWAWGDEEIGKRLANYDRNESGTTPVGTYPPNSYGLFDAAGNVFEWCWDWYDPAWYEEPGASEADTRGPSEGSNRVERGGNWGLFGPVSRVAVRSGLSAESVHRDRGFRIAMSE